MEDTLFHPLGAGCDNFKVADVQLIRIDKENPTHIDEACAHLKISLLWIRTRKAGQIFSAKLVEMALSNIPITLTSPPSDATPGPSALAHPGEQ
ncbi:MAG: hypothetical protein R2861_05720 [Desulfobacterales bacterium]